MQAILSRLPVRIRPLQRDVVHVEVVPPRRAAPRRALPRVLASDLLAEDLVVRRELVPVPAREGEALLFVLHRHHEPLRWVGFRGFRLDDIGVRPGEPLTGRVSG